MILIPFVAHAVRVGHTLRRSLAAATEPAGAGRLVDTLADLPRSKPQLIAENALLRQQLVIPRRSDKRPLWWLIRRA